MTPEEATAHVCCFFRSIQCPNHFMGYNYLKSALVNIIELERVVSNVTKTVYIFVAEQYNTDVANVERCLRTLVNKWWEQCRCGGLFETRPTNKQLLIGIAEQLRSDVLNEIIKEQKRKERREALARFRQKLKEESGMKCSRVF